MFMYWNIMPHPQVYTIIMCQLKLHLCMFKILIDKVGFKKPEKFSHVINIHILMKFLPVKLEM